MRRTNTGIGKCDRPECPFKHEKIDDVKPCEWYERGFCKHAKKCTKGHNPKLICPMFYMGFCPKGPKCEFEQFVDSYNEN